MGDCPNFRGAVSFALPFKMIAAKMGLSPWAAKSASDCCMPILIKDLTADQLFARLSHAGVTLRQARRIHASAVRSGLLPAKDQGIAAKV